MTANDLSRTIESLMASDLSDRANRAMLKDALEEAGRELTAQDYANARSNVVLRYASQSAPAGEDVALLDDTELPFDLSDVTGFIDDDGDFEADNLNAEGGAYGWQFKDWNRTYVCGLWLREDEEVWTSQKEEYDSQF